MGFDFKGFFNNVFYFGYRLEELLLFIFYLLRFYVEEVGICFIVIEIFFYLIKLLL